MYISLLVSTIAVLLLSGFTASAASSVCINFHNQTYTLSPTDIAGEIDAPEANWNNMTISSSDGNGRNNGGTLTSLKNSTGSTVAGMSITVGATSSTQVWPRTGASWGFADWLMHRGGVYPQPKITVSGVPYSNYDVYIYIDAGSNGGQGSVSISTGYGEVDDTGTYFYKFNWQAGSYIKSTATTLAQAQSSAGSNYIVFTNNTASSFTLDCNGTLGGSPTGIAGIQIVERPSFVFGVNLWAYPSDTDLDNIKAAGFSHVRCGLKWAQVEKSIGVYSWNGNNDGWGLDTLMGRIASRYLKQVYVIAYDNGIYPGSLYTSGTSTQRVAFANFAAALVKRYKDYGVLWEIWNEADNAGWQSGEDVVENAEEYMALVNEAVPKMRNAQIGDPNCAIISAGLTETGWQRSLDWLERCLDLGLATKVDGIGIHNYTDESQSASVQPERLVSRLPLMQEVLDDAGVPNIPLIHTEWGARTSQYTGTTTQKEAAQAASGVRNVLVCQLMGIELGVWYEWHGTSGVTGYAIKRTDGTLRPIYTSLKTMHEQLTGWEFEGTVLLPSDQDYAMIYKRGARRKMVLWTTDSTHSVSIPLDTAATSLSTCSMLGAIGSVNVSSNQFTISLSDAPVYVNVDIATTYPVGNGQYKIIAKHSGKAIAVSGSSQNDGAAINQWNYDGAANMKWNVVHLGGGYYKITAQHSGKCMTIQGAGAQNGSADVQGTYDGSAYMQFSFLPAAANDPAHWKIIVRHSGKVLAVSGQSQNNGAIINQWSYDGAANMRWALQKP